MTCSSSHIVRELSGFRGEGLAIVMDEDDAQRFAKLSISLGQNGYAQVCMSSRNFPEMAGQRRRSGLVHQIIMGPRPSNDATVEHLDRNPLNCCRSNMRWADGLTQVMNRKQRDRELPTGICTLPSGRFRAQVTRGDEQKNLGSYETVEQALAVRYAYLEGLADA